MIEGSGTWRVLRALKAGRNTVREIAVHAHLSERDTRTYLGRLKRKKLIEKQPARYAPV